MNFNRKTKSVILLNRQLHITKHTQLTVLQKESIIFLLMGEIDLAHPVEAYQAYLLRSFTFEQELSQLPEDNVLRQMGSEAVANALSRVNEEVKPEVVDALNGILRDHTVRLEKLYGAKQLNSEVGLSTTEVDSAIAEETSRVESDPELQLAVFVLTAGAPAVASTTEVVNPVPALVQVKKLLTPAKLKINQNTDYRLGRANQDTLS